MAGLADHPELYALFQELMAEKEALRKITQDLREDYTRLREEMGPLVRQAHVLARQIRSIEQPRLAAIDAQLSQLARAAGGKSTSTVG